MNRTQMTPPIPLNTVQRWMQAVITHPDGVRAGIGSPAAAELMNVTPADIERVILPSTEVSGLDRLRIYGQAYFGRLIDCLRDQFPATRYALSDEPFDSLAFSYLVRHRSSSYTLASLGDSFDSFLAETRPPRRKESASGPPDYADFLIELAGLERLYGELFHGHGPECTRSLQMSDVEHLSAETFAACRLIPHACVRLLELQFPVHEYISAHRKDGSAEFPPPRPVFLVVTRRRYIVRRFEVTQTQFELLQALVRQMTVGEALQTVFVNHQTDLRAVQVELQNWFRDWSAAPLFAGLSSE